MTAPDDMTGMIALLPIVMGEGTTPATIHLFAGVLRSRPFGPPDFEEVYGPNWRALADFLGKMADLDEPQLLAWSKEREDEADKEVVTPQEVKSASMSLSDLLIGNEDLREHVVAAELAASNLARWVFGWMHEKEPDSVEFKLMVLAMTHAASTITVVGLIPADANFGEPEIRVLTSIARTLGLMPSDPPSDVEK